MPDTNEQFWNQLRRVVREEVQAETVGIKETLSVHSMQLRQVQSSLSNLTNTIRAHGKEIFRIGVLLEDLEYRFEAGSEIA
jgi:hypothetical protein